MFSTANSSKVTAVCVVAMMMMMMMMMMAEAAAITEHPVKTHKNSSHDAAAKMVHLQIDPKAFVSIKTRPLQAASISPWTYNNTQEDSLLHPLSEARCSLRGCLDSQGREDLNLESRPIMHQVLVLRRVRSTGEEPSYHFKLESRLIAVGCTCVRPVVIHQA